MRVVPRRGNGARTMRVKLEDLPPAPAKMMEAMIDAASQPFAEVIGVPLEDVKIAVADLIERGLAKIEVEGDRDDPSTWRARLIVTEEGLASQ